MLYFISPHMKVLCNQKNFSRKLSAILSTGRGAVREPPLRSFRFSLRGFLRTTSGLCKAWRSMRLFFSFW